MESVGLEGGRVKIKIPLLWESTLQGIDRLQQYISINAKDRKSKGMTVPLHFCNNIVLDHGHATLGMNALAYNDLQD